MGAAQIRDIAVVLRYVEVQFEEWPYSLGR